MLIVYEGSNAYVVVYSYPCGNPDSDAERQYLLVAKMLAGLPEMEYGNKRTRVFLLRVLRLIIVRLSTDLPVY